jgi:hypothetical protein
VQYFIKKMAEKFANIRHRCLILISGFLFQIHWKITSKQTPQYPFTRTLEAGLWSWSVVCAHVYFVLENRLSGMEWEESMVPSWECQVPSCGGLGLAPPGSWELTACLLSQLCLETSCWKLEIAMLGVFTQWKLATLQMKAPSITLYSLPCPRWVPFILGI